MLILSSSAKYIKSRKSWRISSKSAKVTFCQNSEDNTLFIVSCLASTLCKFVGNKATFSIIFCCKSSHGFFCNILFSILVTKLSKRKLGACPWISIHCISLAKSDFKRISVSAFVKSRFSFLAKKRFSFHFSFTDILFSGNWLIISESWSTICCWISEFCWDWANLHISIRFSKIFCIKDFCSGALICFFLLSSCSKYAKFCQWSKILKYNLSFPRPNKSLHNLVPRPIICQNLTLDFTGFANTKFTTSGTSMPVSIISTEMAILRGLSLSEKSSIKLSARPSYISITAANFPPYCGYISSIILSIKAAWSWLRAKIMVLPIVWPSASLMPFSIRFWIISLVVGLFITCVSIDLASTDNSVSISPLSSSSFICSGFNWL